MNLSRTYLFSCIVWNEVRLHKISNSIVPSFSPLISAMSEGWLNMYHTMRWNLLWSSFLILIHLLFYEIKMTHSYYDTLSWSCQQPIPKLRILSFPQNLLFVFIWSKRFLSLKGEGSDDFSRASICHLLLSLKNTCWLDQAMQPIL